MGETSSPARRSEIGKSLLVSTRFDHLFHVEQTSLRTKT